MPNDPSEDELAHVKSILAKLAIARQRNFGDPKSARPDFRLNPPLDEAEIARFESQHGIRLPTSYRAFLLCIGNGGAGPYQGLVRLQDWKRAIPKGNNFPRDGLAQAPAFDVEPSARGMIEVAAIDHPWTGTLCLGRYAQSWTMQLVLTGPLAGRVIYAFWYDESGEPPQAYVVEEASFLHWYERWLDELLLGCRMESFGAGPAGGATELFAILGDSTVAADWRGEAARAFHRLPELSPSMLAQLETYLADPSDEIRAGVCASLRQHRVDLRQQLPALIQDRTAEVRIEAVQAARHADPALLVEPLLQQLLVETYPQVGGAIWQLLEAAAALTKADRIRLLRTCPIDSLRMHIFQEIAWDQADVPAIQAMLADPNRHVRLWAVHATQGIRDPDLAAALVQCVQSETDPQIADVAMTRLAELRPAGAAAVFFQWSTSTDDFARIAAVQGLIALGDEQVAPLVEEMLRMDREPERVDSQGFVDMDSIYTIAEIIGKSLKESPSEVLRGLRRPKR